jgi:hypothetical protein
MSDETCLTTDKALSDHPCGRCLTERLHLPAASGFAEVDLEASLLRLVQICHAYDSGEIDADLDSKTGLMRPNCAFPGRPTSLCPFNYVEYEQARPSV